MLFTAYHPQNILIINPYGIGDCLFTTPFITQLKKNFPESKISYLANKRVAPLLERHPSLEKVFIYERDEFYAVYKESKRKFWKKISAFLDIIKRESFDVVFDFSMNGSINFFVWRAGAKHRIGLNYQNRSKFLTFEKRIKGFEGQHVAQYYLDLLEDLGLSVEKSPLELYLKPEDEKWAEDAISSDQKPLIGVFPGGGASWGKSADLKRWPAVKYRELIEKCVENFKGTIILMGDQTEERLCSEVSENLQNVHNFCGKTSLGQFAALLKKCDVAIVNDGGPLHMAVAVGTKTVSIFGPVDESVYGPFGDISKHAVATNPLACRPCYRAFRMSDCTHLSCLQKLEVIEVFKRIEELL